jgi:hypothetical protein
MDDARALQIGGQSFGRQPTGVRYRRRPATSSRNRRPPSHPGIGGRGPSPSSTTSRGLQRLARPWSRPTTGRRDRVNGRGTSRRAVATCDAEIAEHDGTSRGPSAAAGLATAPGGHPAGALEGAFQTLARAPDRRCTSAGDAAASAPLRPACYPTAERSLARYSRACHRWKSRVASPPSRWWRARPLRRGRRTVARNSNRQTSKRTMGRPKTPLGAVAPADAMGDLAASPGRRTAAQLAPAPGDRTGTPPAETSSGEYGTPDAPLAPAGADPRAPAVDAR